MQLVQLTLMLLADSHRQAGLQLSPQWEVLQPEATSRPTSLVPWPSGSDPGVQPLPKVLLQESPDPPCELSALPRALPVCDRDGH